MLSCFICRDADAGSSGCLSSTISCPLLDACCILTQNRRFRLRISTRFGSNKRFMGQTLVADKHTPMHPVCKRNTADPLFHTNWKHMQISKANLGFGNNCFHASFAATPTQAPLVVCFEPYDVHFSTSAVFQCAIRHSYWEYSKKSGRMSTSWDKLSFA